MNHASIKHLGTALMGLSLMIALVGCNQEKAKQTPKTPDKTKKVEAKDTKVDAKKKTVVKKDIPIEQIKKVPPKKAFDPLTVVRNKHTKQQFVLPKDKKSKTIIIDGNPYLSEGRGIKLQWVEPKKSFKLRASPDKKAKVVATIEVEREAYLQFEEAQYMITKPRPFVAKKDFVLKPYSAPFYEIDERKHMGFGAKLETLDLKKGQVVELYHHFPTSNCLLQTKGKFYRAACPEPKDFTCKEVPRDYASAPMKPMESQWWFKIKQGEKTGWLRVDNTVIVTHFKRLVQATGLFEKSTKLKNPPPGLPKGFKLDSAPK